MDVLLNKKEKENKRKGVLVSAIIHTLLLALILLPLLTYPDPPPGQEGILVNLGADFGQGEENAPEPSEAIEADPSEKPVEEEVEPVTEPEVTEEETPVDDTPDREVVETEDPEAIALKKAEKERKKREAEEAKKREEEEQKRREEEAERQRREAEAEANKEKFTDAFGGGDGEGKGNTGDPGNQGSATGDPDASALEGESVGTGQVGGGLSNRGVSQRYKVDNPTNEFGRVVVKVCVDASGQVTSAEYTISGSTTQSSRLRSIAEQGAKKWKFTSSSVSKQCGTIIYDFRPK